MSQKKCVSDDVVEISDEKLSYTEWKKLIADNFLQFDMPTKTAQELVNSCRGMYISDTEYTPPVKAFRMLLRRIYVCDVPKHMWRKFKREKKIAIKLLSK